MKSILVAFIAGLVCCSALCAADAVPSARPNIIAKQLKAAGYVTGMFGKGSLYEGGTREPFVVRWPGVTQPSSTCSVPTIHVDIFPTMLELAGAPKPRLVLDGESLVKLFRDPSATPSSSTFPATLVPVQIPGARHR